MLSELFWISLGLTSEIDGYKKNPRIKFERGNEYVERLGYDRQRQLYLNNLIYAVDEDKQKQFYDILGHKIDWYKYAKYHKKDREWIAKDEAIREISIKEGWRYFDGDELYADPVYRKIIGMETRPPIISYKFYPEKVLMSPEELQQYNIDVEKKNTEFISSTIFSTIFPILFSIIAIIIANCSTTKAGGISYFIFTVIAIAATYFSYYKYKNKPANGNIQFFVYIMCPPIALSNAMNCKSLPIPLMYATLIAMIIHIIWVCIVVSKKSH